MPVTAEIAGRPELRTGESVASTVFDRWRQELSGHDRTVGFADGEDPRAIRAAAVLGSQGILLPRLVGRSAEIQRLAQQLGCEVPSGWILDAGELAGDSVIDRIVSRVRIRKPEQLEQVRQDPVYLAAAALKAGYVDACVAGAGSPTALVLRAALRVVGLSRGCSTLSSSFLMLLPNGRQITFGDCAVVPDPSAEELADIAASAAMMHQTLTGERAKVALLSFSTRDSAVHPHVDKIKNAMVVLRARHPSLQADGELQLDAALVPQIGMLKAPGSNVAGHANVLIFPTLDAANIGYKITERLGGALALGPLLQGLAAPMNDLSRGCTTDDIYSMGLLSARQSLDLNR